VQQVDSPVQPTDIADLLNGVIDQNRLKATAKQQILSHQIEDRNIVSVDAVKITEVFDNLISNAVKYSPLGARITVRCKQVSDSQAPTATRLEISVEDEGLGLSQEDKEKLFGKFQKLSARPTGGESSTGLGLSIVKQIVELHGGKVWAESEGKNKGSTFFISLPY